VASHWRARRIIQAALRAGGAQQVELVRVDLARVVDVRLADHALSIS
jgi:hypothetical protein